jgi:hypothetical protein
MHLRDVNMFTAFGNEEELKGGLEAAQIECAKATGGAGACVRVALRAGAFCARAWPFGAQITAYNGR